MKIAIATAIVCGLSASVVLAEEPVPDQLDEIVVTATRMATPLRSIPRAISVVDKSRIQDATQQLALDEALAGVPGLYMQNRYNFAQDLRISLRGFGARSSFGIRGIRIIVDGIPETLPDGQAQVDSIDIGSAEQIEVLRGPASSLYGNASGGVISVRSELGASPPFAEIRLAGGDYGFRKAQFKTAGEAGVVDYLLNLSRQEIDGYRDHSRAEGDILNGRLGIDISDKDRLMVSLNHVDQPIANDPGGVNLAQATSDPTSARDRNVLFDAGEALSQQRIGLSYEHTGNRSSLVLRNHYVWRDFANKLPFTDGGSVDLDRFFYGVGLQFNQHLLANNALTLTAGFDLDEQEDRRKRFDNNEGVIEDLVFDQDEDVSSKGVYINSRLAVNERVGLHAGIRYDEIDFDVTDHYLDDGDDSGQIMFDETSPSLGLNVAAGGGSLFASWSRSFETPTTTELANPDGSGGFNESLKAQTADNMEIGFRNSQSNFYYEIVAFSIDLKDELVPYEVPAFPGRTFFANAGESSRRGLEGLVRWSGESGLGAELSYTVSDFKYDTFVDNNGNDFAGNTLPGVPQQFGFLRLSYDNGRGWFGAFDVVYSGSLYANNANNVEVDSYTTGNLRFGYRALAGRWHLEPYVGINNLFDETYNSNIRINAFGGRYYEPAPDRNYYAGIIARFQ